MIVDFKITSWVRISLPDRMTIAQREKIIAGIKDGSIDNPTPIENEVYGAQFSPVDDSTEYMLVKENDGNATVEAFEGTDDIEPIATNII